MAHEPKLTVYTIKIKPRKSEIENSNRCLFRHLIGQNNDTELDDKFIFLELFKKFIAALDTPEMFADGISRKCMTANQSNIGNENINANIIPHPEYFVIEGRVEGGSYGRQRNKTSTKNKAERAAVNHDDAITEDFYFLIYMPPFFAKMVLMIQSYSDDTIDSVMKVFWENFFSFEGAFWKPDIKRHVPQSIIDDFKKNTTVSEFQYQTEVAGETLLDRTKTAKDHNYRVTVKITPINGDLTMNEFEEAVEPLNKTVFEKLKNLGNFRRKSGKLRDRNTGNETQFELESNFKIEPTILLRKYVPEHDFESFVKLKEFCFTLLETVKKEIYKDGAKER